MSKNLGVTPAFTSRLVAGSCIAIVVGLSLGACDRRDAPPASAFATKDGQFLVRGKNVKWGDAPPGLPSGAKAALLLGNPNSDGPYVIRLKFPAKYKIPFHAHPKAQNVTVVSGTLFVANTQTYDKKKAFSIKPGDFYHLPGQTPQFVFTNDETVIEIHGAGPYEIKYVNAADDPLKGAAAPEYKFPEGYKDNDMDSPDADESAYPTF